MMIFIDLTTIFFSDVFADKDHFSSRLTLTNVPALNYLLRSEIFVSKDGQMRAAHLILDYMPISRIFQDADQVIRAGSSWLAHINVSKPRFLACRDLTLVQLLFQRAPPRK